MGSDWERIQSLIAEVDLSLDSAFSLVRVENWVAIPSHSASEQRLEPTSASLLSSVCFWQSGRDSHRESLGQTANRSEGKFSQGVRACASTPPVPTRLHRTFQQYFRLGTSVSHPRFSDPKRRVQASSLRRKSFGSEFERLTKIYLLPSVGIFPRECAEGHDPLATDSHPRAFQRTAAGNAAGTSIGVGRSGRSRCDPWQGLSYARPHSTPVRVARSQPPIPTNSIRR